VFGGGGRGFEKVKSETKPTCPQPRRRLAGDEGLLLFLKMAEVAGACYGFVSWLFRLTACRLSLSLSRCQAGEISLVQRLTVSPASS
jgi:hypothetical protein